jgi:hypothetical protein
MAFPDLAPLPPDQGTNGPRSGGSCLSQLILTPVTALTLKNIFGPALTAFPDDRLVSGSTAVLSGFLDAAGVILASGKTIDDIKVDCPNTVELRAERQGTGDGRVYNIVYRVGQDNGTDEDVTVYVYVLHDNGDKCGDIPADGGDGYTVTGCEDGGDDK